MTAEQKTVEQTKKEFETYIESEVKKYYPIDEVHNSDMQYARSAAFWNGARASYPFFEQKTATLQKQLEEAREVLDRREVSPDKIRSIMHEHLDSLPYEGGYPGNWKETLSKSISEAILTLLTNNNGNVNSTH